MTAAPPPNAYQARTSPGKLRGQYYTPAALIDRILEAVELPEGAVVVDPSCGDGGFLRGAVAALRGRHPGRSGADLARAWGPRLVGFDTDPAAIAAAREGLAAAMRLHWGASPPEVGIRQADPLEQPDLAALCAAHDLPAPAGPRVVLGNPPYVEAKRLAAAVKRDLEARYPRAVIGAPDLYLYFLHVCLDWLRPGDSLALVLPNKLLVAAAAARLRERLLKEERLTGLWLATRAGAFGAAQVYPIVLFAAGRHAGPVGVAEVGRTGDDFAVRPRAAVAPGVYGRTAARVFWAPPADADLAALLERLLALPQRLPAALDVRWAVSFHRSGLRENFVTPERRGRCARRFVGGGAFSGNHELERYRLGWGGWWMDYDEGRLRELGNPVPPLALFEQPKIVIAQNARTCRAAWDETGCVLKDTFLAGFPRPGHALGRAPRAAVGLLNSRATHFFYSHVFHGGHVSGGYLHFLRSFLNEIPLGKWPEARAAAAEAAVLARETAGAADRAAAEEAIEGHVAAALGLTAAEAEAVAAWAEADPNWAARGRVGRAPRGNGAREC